MGCGFSIFPLYLLLLYSILISLNICIFGTFEYGNQMKVCIDGWIENWGTLFYAYILDSIYTYDIVKKEKKNKELGSFLS